MLMCVTIGEMSAGVKEWHSCMLRVIQLRYHYTNIIHIIYNYIHIIKKK